MVTQTQSTPDSLGYAMPPEWAKHDACYTAWPAHEYAWGAQLRAAQREFVAFAKAFAGGRGQEPLLVLCDPAFLAQAEAALQPDGERVVLVPHAYGDVWLRDTSAIFVTGPRGRASVRFRFNGWGEKYIYPHDAELAAKLAAMRDEPQFECEYVLEGGAIDVDGEGTALTTRSCLLHENRQGPPDPGDVQARLSAALGIRKLLWLDQGLANDHTDGHIDNIARFVAPGVVACMQPESDSDPNAATLDAIARELEAMTDARGRRLTVVRVPSPGRVLGADGQVAPASHMNFYIGNARVLVPVFGTRQDEPARAAIQTLFPDREVVACSARALLEGGGTLHCMTQQLPSPRGK
jgi:agmatine deiminase